MKKIVLVMMSIIMIVMSMAACAGTTNNNNGSKPVESVGNNEATSDLKATIKVAVAGPWNLEDSIDPVSGNKILGLNNVIKEKFNSKFPNIKLEITEIPWENTQAKQKALLSSNDVDVLYTAGGWASEWNEQGLLMDLNKLIENDPTFNPDDYLQGIWDFSYNTKSLDGESRFGVPSVLGRRMTIYDKQIFDDFGVEYLSATPTPEEILEKAKLLTGINPRTGEQNYGVHFLGNVLDASVFQALSRYYNAPGGEGSLGDMYNIKFNMNTPEMQKVFEFLKEIGQYAPPAFVNGQGGEKFGTETNNIAISLDNGGYGPWSNYIAYDDESYLERFVPVMNIGPDGGGYVAVDPFVIAQNTKKPEAAWEVLKFLTSYDVQKHMYETLGFTPTLTNADFVVEHDIYVAKAMEIADVSKSNLMDEVNPYFNSEVVPAVNIFISLAANNQAPDISEYLDNLQDRAEKWQQSKQ